MLRKTALGITLAALSVLSFSTSPLFAQSGRNSLSGFARKSPDVGARLPDVTLLAADGKPFKLRDLRGGYSVLVFGCLT